LDENIQLIVIILLFSYDIKLKTIDYPVYSSIAITLHLKMVIMVISNKTIDCD